MSDPYTTFPEPAWEAPSQEIDELKSSLDASGKTPFIMTGALKRLIEYHFSTPDNITNPKLHDYIWTEDPRTSRLYVATAFRRDGVIVQQKPAVYIRRSQVTAGPKPGLRGRSVSHVNRISGKYEGSSHQIFLTGVHFLVCEGKNGAEVESLSEEIFFRMLHFGPVILDDLKLGALRVAGISDIRARPQMPQQTFYAMVRIEWSTMHQWRVIPETPLVKRLHVVMEPFKAERGLT